jgi:LacI family transcriptional regulator
MKSNTDVTIYDVARALNISPSTVSRALNDHPLIRKDTKRKIRHTAHEMGYQRNKFASNLRQKRTNTLGVVVPRLNSYFMATVIAGMEKITNQQDYNLIISQSQELLKSEVSGVLTLYNSRVDGLLASLSNETKNLDHFNILFKKGIPVVFFDRVVDCPGCTSIVIDNYKAGYEATTHLIQKGCKRIIHIGGSLIRNVYADRYRGYKQALLDNGLVPDDDLVMISELSDHAGADFLPRIKNLQLPSDGIFAANDTSAVSVICELKKAGIRVPEDIAVVGFNNDPISRVIEPNLTTVHYPGMEMGEIAALTIINKLNNKQTTNLSTIVLEHSLIIRESSQR